MRCTPCGMAQTNLDLNFNCTVAFSARNPNPDEICTGTCRTLGDAFVANCDTVVS